MNELTEETGNISILLAEDHPLMRKAIRITLEDAPDITVVGEAKNGEEAIAMADQLLPDLIIMDINMPSLNGLEATREIKTRHSNIAILVLTVYDDNEHVLGMLEAGAAGYLTKSVSDQDLLNAIRATISGEAVIANSVFNQVLRYSLKRTTKPAITAQDDRLSAQDLEILKLAASGLSNRNIASKLNLSPFTVKNYMVEIFSKLQVSSRTEAVIAALRAGLIKLQDF
jgi:DNA-binding NarL/FixJ family response regulator